MIENNAPPLTVAERVLLHPESLAAVSRQPFTLRGWAILDRWAMNSPAALQSLEGQGLQAFTTRLLEQQERESNAVLALVDQVAAGVPELELLQLAGVDTELTVRDDLPDWDAAPPAGRELL